MSVFFKKQVAAAISRRPGMGSKQIRELRPRAEHQQRIDLAAACDDTLGTRPIEFYESSAERNVHKEQQPADVDLVDAIRYAFGKAPPAKSEEIRFLRWLTANPGGTHQGALAAYGEGDASLLVDHLVYDRPASERSSSSLSRIGRAFC